MLSGPDAPAFAGEDLATRPAPARAEPLPLMADRGRSADYPVDALGPLLAAAAQATARHAYAPIAMAAQSTLAAVSLAIQPHFDVELPTGNVRPTSLHLVTSADSGDRKSTCDDFAMQPIWRFQDSLEEQAGRERVDAQHAQAAWDETRKAVTQQNKNRGREALEEAYRELGPRPDGPLDPQIVVRSGSTQGLLKRFLNSRPSLGLMSDEGGSWLGGFGMTEDNRLLTIATLSDFWDGKTVQTNTAGEGFNALRGVRLAFHLMIQPAIAGRLLGNAEAQGQGFLSRLLCTHPDSLAGTRFVDPAARESDEDKAAVAAYRQRLDGIITAPLPTLEGGNVLQPRVLAMSPDAKAMWWEFYNSIEARLGPDGDLAQVKGFVGKLPEQAARLAANVAVFHRGANIPELDAAGLARGIRLAEYYLSEALRLFGQAAPSERLQAAQMLSDWLRDQWKENLISISAISQNGPNQLRKGAEYVRELVDTLVRHDHLIEVPNGGMVSGKKVRQAWRVMVR
jgi:hypothetical protein